jgi:tetratricopeptide (TPR) repeat protein
VVLAEILKARGKGDDAAFFERVVSAVRIAETGDRMTDAGMLKKSLALYEQASNLFGDAYCVQWRLAERLSSMGDLEEARKHYEIAFERMPEQFGQVASFCFGCEGVFTHQQSVGVAERVLTGLSLTAPDKPQVQYLLGQLRESQGRKAEAYRHFSRAAEIDPGYLDALKSAYKLSDDVFLSQAEMDLLALRMLRLDPLLRHNGLEPGGIADVKGVWEIYAENSAKREAPVKSLLPLTASKQELETVVRKLGGSLDLLEMKRSLFSRDQRSIPEPGEAVVRTQFELKLLQYAATNSLGME